LVNRGTWHAEHGDRLADKGDDQRLLSEWQNVQVLVPGGTSSIYLDGPVLNELRVASTVVRVDDAVKLVHQREPDKVIYQYSATMNIAEGNSAPRKDDALVGLITSATLVRLPDPRFASSRRLVRR
jgi:hypothetical protein